MLLNTNYRLHTITYLETILCWLLVFCTHIGKIIDFVFIADGSLDDVYRLNSHEDRHMGNLLITGMIKIE